MRFLKMRFLKWFRRRGGQPQFQGHPGELIERELAELLDRWQMVNDKPAQFFLLSYGQRAAYVAWLISQRRYVDEVLVGEIRAIAYNGLPLFVSKAPKTPLILREDPLEDLRAAMNRREAHAGAV